MHSLSRQMCYKFNTNVKFAMFEMRTNPWKGRAYGNLGSSNVSAGDSQKAIEYHKKHLKIAVEIGDWAGEGALIHYSQTH